MLPRPPARTSRLYAAPELLATGPNQLWSWDITKLKGPAKWTYYYLYVVLDVFSRYVVGWMAAHRESSLLAEQLIATSCERQAIRPGQLTVHADRGSAMTSKPVALLMSDLGVTKTHSRPSVSNDNPYSEAQFKTLKYRPDFPERSARRPSGVSDPGAPRLFLELDERLRVLGARRRLRERAFEHERIRHTRRERPFGSQ